jgi:hypothetical protein
MKIFTEITITIYEVQTFQNFKITSKKYFNRTASNFAFFICKLLTRLWAKALWPGASFQDRSYRDRSALFSIPEDTLPLSWWQLSSRAGEQAIGLFHNTFHIERYNGPRLYSKVWPMLSIFDSNKQKTAVGNLCSLLPASMGALSIVNSSSIQKRYWNKKSTQCHGPAKLFEKTEIWALWLKNWPPAAEIRYLSSKNCDSSQLSCCFKCTFFRAI